MEDAENRNRQVIYPFIQAPRLAGVRHWFWLLLAACFLVWIGASAYFLMAFDFWIAVLLSSFSLIFVLFIMLLPVLSIIGNHLDANG